MVSLVVHKWSACLVTVGLSWHVHVSASLVKSLLEVVAPVHNTMRTLCCICWTCFATHTHKICFLTVYHRKESWRTLFCNKFSPLSEWDCRTAVVQGLSFSYELLSMLSSTYNLLSQAGNNQENQCEDRLCRHTVFPVQVHFFSCCVLVLDFVLCPCLAQEANKT